MMKMFYLLVLCRLREFRREPSAIFFVVFFPLVLMTVIYFIFDFSAGDKGDRVIDFIVPGLLAFSIFTTCLFGLGMTFVTHRREQLLKRYLMTPMPTFVYILSHLVGRQLIMLVEMVVIMGCAMVLFDFSFKGSIWLFLVLCSLGTAMMSFFALVLASRTIQTSFYNGLANLILLPLMLLGEVWRPLENLPYWLQMVSEYSPLTPLVTSVRDVASSGATVTDVLPRIVIMAVYTVVFALLGHRLFVWYSHK
ncbi:MAG: ABC transporter permease [Proteobacteria bacterium]|nr:ABC transporter permease [Pseudomonadota bacterium]